MDSMKMLCLVMVLGFSMIIGGVSMAQDDDGGSAGSDAGGSVSAVADESDSGAGTVEESDSSAVTTEESDASTGTVEESVSDAGGVGTESTSGVAEEESAQYEETPTDNTDQGNVEESVVEESYEEKTGPVVSSQPVTTTTVATAYEKRAVVYDKNPRIVTRVSTGANKGKTVVRDVRNSGSIKPKESVPTQSKEIVKPSVSVAAQGKDSVQVIPPSANSTVKKAVNKQGVMPITTPAVVQNITEGKTVVAGTGEVKQKTVKKVKGKDDKSKVVKSKDVDNKDQKNQDNAPDITQDMKAK